jgi:hypothetical protein
MTIHASLPHGRRVHWLRDGSPACGGGRHGKKGAWQTELGEVTCQRCLGIARAAAEKKMAGVGVSTT